MTDDDDLDALRNRLITVRQGLLARFTSLGVRTVPHVGCPFQVGPRRLFPQAGPSA